MTAGEKGGINMTDSQGKSCRYRPSRQSGQSMIEFTVVVVFFCLALTSDPALNVMERLMDVLKERNEHYSYTVSLSDYPDTTIFEEFKQLLIDQLREQGYSNEEIAAILDEKSGMPVNEWADFITEYTGTSFPDVGDLPNMAANALESGDPAELFQ